MLELESGLDEKLVDEKSFAKRGLGGAASALAMEFCVVDIGAEKLNAECSGLDMKLARPCLSGLGLKLEVVCVPSVVCRALRRPFTGNFLRCPTADGEAVGGPCNHIGGVEGVPGPNFDVAVDWKTDGFPTPVESDVPLRDRFGFGFGGNERSRFEPAPCDGKLPAMN